jgi:hypothetical protein
MEAGNPFGLSEILNFISPKQGGDGMNIPAQMQPVYEEIAGMIEEYCEKYMN